MNYFNPKQSDEMKTADLLTAVTFRGGEQSVTKEHGGTIYRAT